MSRTAQSILIYGVPISAPEIYDWELKNKTNFDPMPMHGCEHIVYGDMDVEAHSAIGISLSEREAYAGEIVDIDPLDFSNWEQRQGWDTDLTRTLLDLGLDYKKPRWMLLCFCG